MQFVLANGTLRPLNSEGAHVILSEYPSFSVGFTERMVGAEISSLATVLFSEAVLNGLWSPWFP